MQRLLLFTLIAVFASSCSDEDKRQALLPNVTGKAGEVVLIIGQDREAGPVGKKLDSVFNQFQMGLPQDEPLFDLITIPPSAFQNVFERHRNIVNLSIKPAHKTPQLLMKEDEWAHPQTYVSLQAGSDEEMLQLIDSVQDNILKLFLSVDRKRTTDNYRQYSNPTVTKKLKKAFGFDMVVPNGYNIDVNDSAFMWITYETRDMSQGLIIYTQEYDDTTQLTPQGINTYRDSLFKMKVPGPRHDSYMQTERNLYEPISMVHTLMEGQYTVEMRGLWRVENDFMGGPFLSYAIYDSQNNRIINIFSYLYLPRKDKRNYMRQLEAIARTFQFVKEPEATGK